MQPCSPKDAPPAHSQPSEPTGPGPDTALTETEPRVQWGGGAHGLPKKGPGGAEGSGRASPPQGGQQDWTQPSAVLTLHRAGRRREPSTWPCRPLCTRPGQLRPGAWGSASPAGGEGAGEPAHLCPSRGRGLRRHCRHQDRRAGGLTCLSHPGSGRSRERPCSHVLPPSLEAEEG